VISTRAEGAHPAPGSFRLALEVAADLIEGEDFFLNADAGSVRLTPSGERRIQSGEWAVPWADLRRPWGRYVENALRVRYLIKPDVTYIVQDCKAIIIDEFTGRARPDSSWRDGLHQAVEAAAGLEIGAESESAASISRQRFFRLYDEVAGMTGTALTSAGEFWEIFSLPVVPIPRHQPSKAVTLPCRIFVSESAKFAAVTDDIAKCYAAGQPVLVGSRTIRNSEVLSGLLTEAAIPHRVLNARQDAHEAATIAQAGERGAVTIATNMAGRGTHISLGAGVADLGGLHVICLEMEESRRIDLQLIGRTARQGSPGSSRTYLSADDHLLRRYGAAAARRLASVRVLEDGEVPGDVWLREFERAQQRAERLRYHSRLELMHRDEWLSETKRRLG
jgi:preprotein translocase subunit SecA